MEKELKTDSKQEYGLGSTKTFKLGIILNLGHIMKKIRISNYQCLVFKWEIGLKLDKK